jgi:formylglycine-generating enzyme required for sulfatase activity
MQLVRIPRHSAGSFPGVERHRGEILIQAHEVTVGQFRAFVDSTRYVTEAEQDPRGGWGYDPATGEFVQQPGWSWRKPGFEQGEDHPVVMLSWKDAEAFCEWLSSREQRTYRLPTEREWEHAGRAGSEGAYFFGDHPARLDEVANFADAPLLEHYPFATWAHLDGDGYAFTAPVGSFRANPYGLYDFHGNVWEWCADWYGLPPPEVSAEWSDSMGFRVIRGGGWSDPPERCRIESSIYFRPTFRYCQLSGFRVVLDET